MGCPHCQSSEISPDGVCLICGLRLVPDTPAQSPETADIPTHEPEAEQEALSHSGMIEMDYSEGAQEAEERPEVPQWRQELSQRLHEIKQKRESVTAAQQESIMTAPVSQAKSSEALSALQAMLLEKMPPRKPQPPADPPPRQKTLEPLEPEPPVPEPVPQPARPRDGVEIQSLIDNAVSRQAVQAAAPAVAPQATVPVFVAEDYEPGSLDQEGKLILLSRTLSGLVDLIVLVLCTGVFIICADFFSGILVLDRVSLMNFSALFLLNFFLYSLFFLSATNQTIGMMITDLRVSGAGERRPTLWQLLVRCCMYLVSLFGLGIGLLLGLLDRDNRCLHDRASGTHVERI